MNTLTRAQRDYVEGFLRTGKVDDTVMSPWQGGSFAERSRATHGALRGALIAEVRRRQSTVVLPTVPRPRECRAMTRRRVGPMVRGLFTDVEQETILALLERGVVFLTPTNIEAVLHEQCFDDSAWSIANLYLKSIDADLLADDAPDLLGLSQEATCFLTAWYLDGRGKFDDFLVHEAAHVFHNWRREFSGLPHTPTNDWLLPVDFEKRETFAYGCEIYSRIIEQSETAKQRQALLDEYSEHPHTGAEAVDEHLDILREAVSARDGWQCILRRCAVPESSQLDGARRNRDIFRARVLL